MTVETSFRVRYAETDQMGVVYYANYLVWMEIGRAEYCRSIGIRYRDMEQEDGILLAVVKADCRFIHPARYDDEILMATTIRRSHPRLVAFHYSILRAGDRLPLAEGETTHVFCGRDLKPGRLPRKYWDAFGIGRRAADSNAAANQA